VIGLEYALKEFLLSLKADGLSKSTQEWYQWLLTAFVDAHYGLIVNEIKPHDVRAYIVEIRSRHYADDTVAAHIRAQHRFWKWAASEYNISNPMRGVKYPAKRQPQPKAANMEDIEAMFQAAGDGDYGLRNRAMLIFMLDTGCRAAGVINLRLDMIDFEGHRALVTEKGNKTRYVVFTALTARLLAEWIARRQPDTTTVFYDLKTLQPLKRNGLYQVFRRMARRAGIEGRFNPHSLRHTFAREYIMNGGDLATLAKLLGHRDVSTTVSHYAIFTDAELAEKHEKYSPTHGFNVGL
jgi:integrase/recombinase XerD